MTPPPRIRVTQDRITKWWTVSGIGDPRPYPTWAAAYALAEHGARVRREAAKPVPASVLAAVLELHRPVVLPYPGAPGFHTASCRVCDGGRARVFMDGTPPYACPVWARGIRVGVITTPTA